MKTHPLRAALACFPLALVAASPPVRAQNLIWEAQGLTDEASVPSGSTFAYNGAVATLTWSITSNGGLTTYPGGNGSAGGGDDYVSYESSMEGAHTGLLLLSFDNAAYDKSDFITLTISFSTPQTRLYFSLLDIDSVRQSGGGGWDDLVDLYINGSTSVAANTSWWSFAAGNATRTVVVANEPGFSGWEGRPGSDGGTFDWRANSDQNIGNINVNLVGVSVSNFTITFRSTDDVSGNPGGQKIGISDLLVIPEGGAGLTATLVLALCGVAGIRRARRRRVNSGVSSDSSD